MAYITICLVCGKTWTPKNWENFLDFCGTCTKEWKESFQKMVDRKRRIRVEEDGA